MNVLIVLPGALDTDRPRWDGETVRAVDLDLPDLAAVGPDVVVKALGRNGARR